MTTEATDNTAPTPESPADLAERIYRERRAAGDSAERAQRDALATAINTLDAYTAEGREAKRAVHSRLDAIAAPDLTVTFDGEANTSLPLTARFRRLAVEGDGEVGRREAKRAVHSRLDAIAAPDLRADAVATFVKRLGGAGILTAEGATKAREFVNDLRAEGHAADADRVELALCREALRAASYRSNEADVRALAWAARGL